METSNLSPEQSFDYHLELTKNRIEIAKFRLIEKHGFYQKDYEKLLSNDIAKMLEEIYGFLNQSKRPEDILKHTLHGMELIDKKSFILDNFLEGLKRGEKPAVLLNRYHKLGLTNFNEITLLNNETEANGLGIFLTDLKKNFLRKPKSTLITLLKVTTKIIPKLVKVKFTSRLSSGFIPMPELSLSDEADLSDFIDPVLEALED